MPDKESILEEIFNDNRKNYFNKIYEGIDNKLDREFASVNLTSIRNMFDSFKTKFGEYYPMEHFLLIDQIFKEISYPFDRLELFLKGSKKINKKTAHIFTYFIYHKMEELKILAKEIDEESK